MLLFPCIETLYRVVIQTTKMGCSHSDMISSSPSTKVTLHDSSEMIGLPRVDSIEDLTLNCEAFELPMLKSLRSLTISYIGSPVRLPFHITHLTILSLGCHLDLSYMTNLHHLSVNVDTDAWSPDSVNRLVLPVNLLTLSLTRVLCDLSQLNRLQSLRLYRCEVLGYSELPSLQEMYVKKTRVQRLKLQQLKSLVTDQCCIDSVSGCPKLEVYECKNNSEPWSLDVSDHQTLRELKVTKTNLVKLVALRLPNIERIECKGNPLRRLILDPEYIGLFVHQSYE